MKVAIISQHSGELQRGAENWAQEIASRLAKNVDIITSNYLLQLNKLFKYDILVPVNGRVQVLLIKIFSIIFNKKLIIFGHSGPGRDDKWNLLMNPNYFVVFSDAQKKWAENNKFFSTKIVKINHAVDINRFTSAKSKPKNIVLCVAANVASKRINLIQKAVSKLKNVDFMVVGAGNELQAKYDNMPQIYKKATIFAFTPEKWEAFGLVYLEALASNLPVVTINDHIRREIVGNAGILVKDPTDIDKLAHTIKKALNKNWKDIPRKQAEKFSWEETLPKYKKLFQI